MVAFPRLPVLNARTAPIAGAAAGVAVAALFVAVPAGVLEDWVWASGVPALVAAAAPPLGTTARAVLALAGGAMTGSVVWALLYLLVGPGGLLASKTVASAVPVVRRADAHPDAPPRRPMTAAEMGTPLMEVASPPVVQDLPADLDQPLAAFDPAAIPEVPLEPLAKVEPLAKLEPRVRTALAPGERIDTYVLTPPSPAVAPEPKRAAAGVQPSIEALLRRLEEVAAQRVGIPAQ